LTLENWTDILFVTLTSSAGAVLSSLYLVSWIFIGNYVFLNLFLAILLDGFTEQGNEDARNELKSMFLTDKEFYEEG